MKHKRLFQSLVLCVILGLSFCLWGSRHEDTIARFIVKHWLGAGYTVDAGGDPL